MALVFSLMCLPHTVFSLAPAPFDYLVPPPLQQTNVAATRLKPANPQNLLPLESRTIQKFIKPQPLGNPGEQHPGLMARVARWFGFANQNSISDQQLTQETNKQPYVYQKPQQQYANSDKENCYLCNKYPWVPMMQNSIQFPQSNHQWDDSKQTQLQTYAHISVSNGNSPQNSYFNHAGQQLQNTYAFQSPPQIQHAASNVKQRAVRFNFPLPFVPTNGKKIANIPPPNHIQYSTGPFLPIPVPPFFSNAASPPVYNAQNFQQSITPIPNSIQELTSPEPVRFSENIGEHSELHVDTVIPTQLPPTAANNDASFEIVKSHQLVDYVSSVEYPASYVPSHSYDVSSQVPTLDQQSTKANVNTGLYQYPTLSPHLSQHVPASQILTQPGSFITGNPQQNAQSNDIAENNTIFNIQQQVLESKPQFADDNYVAASSHQNSSVLKQTLHQLAANYDAWTLQSNDFAYTTSTPEIFSTIEQVSTLKSELDTTTAPPQPQDNEIEVIASIQTSGQQPSQQTSKIWPQKTKQRETPKRLLDSPIQHVNGNFGAPRPFTRDPSDLSFRLPPSNHKPVQTYPVTPSKEIWKQQIAATELPIASSTFSSIDASGQYAGMPPPSLPSTYNSDQILLPHLIAKNRPRPFEATRTDLATKSPVSTATYNRIQSPTVELHTPEESMLVRSHIKPSTTTTTTAKPRTTKYLTRILATNLRELLQREHEPPSQKPSPNSLDIDINKLQKNIDDWTEQEYTSLSHRPSTPTIRGRSKHIPSEYFPATTVAIKTRQSKTSKSFPDTSELPSSINNLEPLYERGSTKHYQYTQITDNHLRDFYNSFEALPLKTSTIYRTTTTISTATTPPVTNTTISSTTSSTTTTTEKPLYLRPIQIQEPEELWKKAKVSISPKTQEKVYVVTPQPKFFPQRFYSSTVPPSSTPTREKSLSILGSGFKSPRFLVRPTPGNDTEPKENSKESSSNSYFSPEWFGLRGLSAYVPAEPVEIIDGNSKVLNIATPPSDSEKTTHHNIMDLTKDRHSVSKRKSTMAPLPR